MSRLPSPTLVPATLVGLAVAAVVRLVGLGPVPALVAAAVVAVGGGIVVSRRSAGAVRRSLSARPALVGEFPRLHNTVDGLCLTHGIEHPGLFVIDTPAGNAAALAGPNGASIVLTTGAVDRLGLVELEALVAHLLVRCADGHFGPKPRLPPWAGFPEPLWGWPPGPTDRTAWSAPTSMAPT